MAKKYKIIDGNTAAADIAYRTNEICIIYPITPASLMGELADEWSGEQKPNVYDTVPIVEQMQSEGGAAGAIHGALQTGSLVTTFTASQGLLLMIPDMYRIAGELTPTVFHVASRAVATQGMTIYCEHSDVMATRATGFAFLSSSTVQEAHDMALIAQAATLKSKVPFLHFFDGFRTSHEVNKIDYISDNEIRQMLDNKYIQQLRQDRMSPDNSTARGVIYNSDIYFQQRETINPYYDKTPTIVNEYMQRFAKLTGREYNLVEYFGHPQAEKIIVIMGSATQTVRETIEFLHDEKIGVIQIRLFQPFPQQAFIAALPTTCKTIAVLDRCKEPGAAGEPLYQKIATTILEYATQSSQMPPRIIAGRYGIGGKEFTPAMVKAIYDELNKEAPKQHFTIGINDDITHSSLTYDQSFNIASTNRCAIFYGLGADGTVSANKNSIKIIGEATDNQVQAYFVYDSRKSGSRTISHLRFGPNTIRSAYLISQAGFIGCHQFSFINTLNVLDDAKDEATLLLNSPFSAEEVWPYLATKTQQKIIDKKIKLYVIDAYKLATEIGLGSRINTIMQTGFFALTDILPTEEAINRIKDTIKSTYANKGEAVINKNIDAVNAALANIKQVDIPDTVITTTEHTKQHHPKHAVTLQMLDHAGNDLPVSALPANGTYPIGTTKLEQRDISPLAPVWNSESCIQCGRCNLVCPHGVIRTKHYANSRLKNAPVTFQSAQYKNKSYPDNAYTIQVYPENCTGCGLCVASCPVQQKSLMLEPKKERISAERANVNFFDQLPNISIHELEQLSVNSTQFLQPLFEFSGACAGCGEAPYVKLLSKLFGHRLLIANACGCSSVFGGNLPTSPWTCNDRDQGPTWSSSLFEDNAEFALGFELSEMKQHAQAKELLQKLSGTINQALVADIINATQTTNQEIEQQHTRVQKLKQLLNELNTPEANNLLTLADFLIKHSVWAVGGDGWAYDIGFGGLDHVIASGRNVNMLVLDTEVYSNTGGQASKSTPRGSVVKFAAQGKLKAKKDLAQIAMTYGDVYVASIALGANPTQAIKAFIEAENYPGPSLIIAYCHCIAHGIEMHQGLNQQELAVKSGYWPLFRFDPRQKEEGKNPLQLDSKAPTIPFSVYAENENRYKILLRSNPTRAKELMRLAAKDAHARFDKLEKMAKE